MKEKTAEEIIAARDTHTLAVLFDLKLRPSDGGPYYFTLAQAGDEPRKHMIHPRDVEGLFQAMFDRLGGYPALEAWRERERKSIRESVLLDLERHEYAGLQSLNCNKSWCTRCGRELSHPVHDFRPRRKR